MQNIPSLGWYLSENGASVKIKGRKEIAKKSRRYVRNLRQEKKIREEKRETLALKYQGTLKKQ